MSNQQLADAEATASIAMADDMQHAIDSDTLPLDVTMIVGLTTPHYTVHGVALETDCYRRIFACDGKETAPDDPRRGQWNRNFLYGLPLPDGVTVHEVNEDFFVALCSGNGVMLETHLHDLGFDRAASVTSTRCRIRPLTPGENREKFDV